MSLYLAIQGYLDDVPVNKIALFEQDFHRFLDTNHPELMTQIETEKELTSKIEESLKSVINEFKQTATYQEE